MSVWDIESESAGIVLVGNFNPRIFHPEWLIRKKIIEEWDYKEDNNNICVRDIARVDLPDSRDLTVQLEKFSANSHLASNHPSLSDMVVSILDSLKETPIRQLGMNYVATVKFRDEKSWISFGKQLAPDNYWAEAAGYIDELPEEEANAVGLWEITMNLPRPDGLVGFIRPKIEVKSVKQRTLTFSTNNHVVIAEDNGDSASLAVEILSGKWESSLKLARQIVERILSLKE